MWEGRKNIEKMILDLEYDLNIQHRVKTVSGGRGGKHACLENKISSFGWTVGEVDKANIGGIQKTKVTRSLEYRLTKKTEVHALGRQILEIFCALSILLPICIHSHLRSGIHSQIPGY